MNITFITDYRNMTFEHYPKQLNNLVEWRLIENLSRNAELIRAFDRNTSPPMIRKFSHID